NGIALDEPYLYAVDGTPQSTTPDGTTTIWHIQPGELFVMGDHRAQSSDSRVFGPIKIDTVIGRAWLRYWPLNTLEVLPTDSHPAPTSPAPSAPAAPPASPKPSPKPSRTPRPSRTPKP